MLENLDHVLYAKGISKKAFADYLGVSEKTVSNKIGGITEFTYSEIKKMLSLLPEYNMDYLLTPHPQVRAS